MTAYFIAFTINGFLLFLVSKVVFQLRNKSGKYYEVLSETVVPIRVVKILAYLALVNLLLLTVFSLLNIVLLLN